MLNKEVAHKLEDAIIECGNNFSRNDREHNHNNEDFINGRRVANSGNAALVLYDKVPGNKVALFNFYYLRNAKRNGVTGYWVYFASSYEMLPIFKLTEQ